jgi:hypothetical protein
MFAPSDVGVACLEVSEPLQFPLSLHGNSRQEPRISGRNLARVASNRARSEKTPNKFPIRWELPVADQFTQTASTTRKSLKS